MAVQRALVWVCSLAVLTSAAPDESSPQNCSSQAQLIKRLSADLEMVLECNENPVWTGEQTAEVLLVMRNLTTMLHKHQLKECQGAEPKRCPGAEVPENGGLACVTIADRRYCKPMCNHGYDFGFLRHSRLYEECSQRTGYAWTTQYVGGKKLAVCNKSIFPASGLEASYFPKDQDCLTAKKSAELWNGITSILVSELRARNVQGEPRFACLVCG